MNRNELLKIIESHPKWYQKIDLPEGLSTPGRDRSKTANNIFPQSLEGNTVLDVGCAEGFFCFEAKKRNADEVTGIDLDNDKLSVAKTFSTVLDLPVEFKQGSFDTIDNLGTFDYIICLNILHHVTDPIYVINKLINMTRKTLILEVADLTMGIADIGRKRKSKAMLGWWGPIFKYLPSSLKPSIMAVDSRARFLITRNWIKDLVETQYLDIENLEFIDSELEHRYIIKAEMRNIDELNIISGPTNVGKSELLAKLRQQDADLYNKLGINKDKSFYLMTASELQNNPSVKLNNLVLEYDICRTILRRYGIFEHDPVLKIFRNAKNKNVYILVCSRKENIHRTNESYRKLIKPKKKDKTKTDRILLEYSQPDKYLNFYKEWIKFCKDTGCNIKFVDINSENLKIIGEEEALNIISS
ncbi:MAG: methyltransferase domain-containing protein [Candidatus Dadabacteria bacterium]|nr:methyltransferase domain-containing protein [Candidatus Dadabacteria bacterium]NIQ14429.1 methyltransferase domain-containing protein [Candidatus Dadabacteria bacterium]